MCWLTADLIVFNFIVPALGVADGYGIFVLIGGVASLGLFTAISNIPTLLADINDNQAINYYLTMPMPQWLVFVRYILGFAITSFASTVILLPISKIILWQTFDLSNFSIIKYVIIFPLMQLFFGSFALLVTAYISDINQYEQAWARFVLPLSILGCYLFPWQVMQKQVYWLAYINLVNPIVYVMEGFRGAFLGHEGYLDFWLCCGMILFFTVLSAVVGINKFMKRLDCLR